MPAVDVVPGDTSTTAWLEVGVEGGGVIEYRFDTDWFRVNLSAGVGYQVTVLGAGGEPVWNQFVTVYSGTGGSLASDDDSGVGFYPMIDVFEPESSGTYFIGVGAFTDLWSYVGQYTVLITPLVDTIA